MIRFLWTKLVWLICIVGIVHGQGQGLRPAQLNYLSKNAMSLHLDSNYANGDWSEVSKCIKEKRIVLLGEFSHGAGEIFTARNDLIKHIHEKLYFDVIVFEAGVGEVMFAELNKSKLSPAQMTQAFFGTWQTDEFVELMSYIKSENISIAGFDVQRSGGGRFKFILEDAAVKNGIDSSLYVDLEKRFGVLKNKLPDRKTVYDSVAFATHELINAYQNVRAELGNGHNEKASRKSLLLQRTIDNRITFLTYMLEFVQDKNWNKRWAARDSAMAENTSWLLETIYPDQKIIMIGHNFHISRYCEKEEVMGEFLSDEYGHEMYTMGFFAGQGKYAGNYGDEITILPPDSTQLDIKHVISELEGRAHFINIPKRAKAGSEWLFNDIVISDSFIDLSRSNAMVLSKHFDGIILIDEVSRPTVTFRDKN